jgi:hypothetical protein
LFNGRGRGTEQRIGGGAALEKVDMCAGETMPYSTEIPWFM